MHIFPQLHRAGGTNGGAMWGRSKSGFKTGYELVAGGLRQISSLTSSVFTIVMMLTVSIMLTGCGEGDAKTSADAAPATQGSMHIAYQYGIGYAPAMIAKEQGYLEQLLPNVEITWQLMNSGSTINAATIAGDIDFALMGTAPFLIGIDKGVPYKLFTGMSTYMPTGLVCSDPKITKLSDFTAEDRIAVVSYGSIQHILLAMGADKYLGDPHALDNNIISMSNPEGFATLLAGKSEVKAQLASVHYYMRLIEHGYHDIMPLDQVFMAEPTLLLGAISTETLEDHPEYLEAMRTALEKGRVFLREHPEEAAAILAKIEGTTPEQMSEYLQYPTLKFTEQTQGIFALAQFMAKAGFISKAPQNFADFATANLDKSN